MKRIEIFLPRLGILALLLFQTLESQAAGRAATTAVQAGAADYCSVVLAPKLMEELKLDVVQRVRLALVEDTLMPRVKNALSIYLGQPGNRQTLQRDTTQGEELMIRALDYSGTSVLEVLTPEQKQAFDALRSSGKVAPVRVRFIGRVPSSGPVVFEVLFSAFGETAKAEDPVTETTAQEDGKTVTRTEVHIKETRGDGKALAQIKTVPEALQVLDYADAKVWRLGAIWLLNTASVDDAARPAVLAALKTRVTGATEGGLDPLRRPRQMAMEALCKWADRNATPALQEIMRLPKEYRDCHAAALKTLLRIDPDSAEAAIRAQLDDFFFRNDVKKTLQSLTDADGVSKDTVTKMLALVDNHKKGHLPREASDRPLAGGLKAGGDKTAPAADDSATLLADLKSGDNRRTTQAVLKLARTTPDTPNPDLAAALTTILLDGRSMPLRVNAAKALEVWGTADSLPALKKAAEDSNPTLQIHAKKAIENISANK